MEKRGWALAAVVVPITTIGAGLIVWAWGHLAASGTLGLAFLLAAMYAAAEAWGARMRERVTCSIAATVMFAGVVLGGAPLAVAAVTIGAFVGLVVDASRTRSAEYLTAKVAFNTGQMAIGAYVAGTVFTVSGGAAVTSPRTWLALAFASAIYTVINPLLVALPIRALTGERITSILRSILETSALALTLHAGLALLAVGLVLHDPWALLLIVPPVVVSRLALAGYERETVAYDRLVDALLRAIAVKDGYTAGHTDRVAQLCVEVAREYDLSYEELRAIRYAARLHDIGKLAIPSAILNKPGPLTADEFADISRHPALGAEILEGVAFLQPIIDGVRCHHERIDGCGYPFGLQGEEIPLIARIITACDAFDAMTSTRSYRRAMPVADALTELHRHAGTQFDAEVVGILDRVVERLAWEPTDVPDRVLGVAT